MDKKACEIKVTTYYGMMELRSSTEAELLEQYKKAFRLQDERQAALIPSQDLRSLKR